MTCDIYAFLLINSVRGIEIFTLASSFSMLKDVGGFSISLVVASYFLEVSFSESSLE